MLGIQEGKEQFIVGTPKGCFACRSVKRLSKEDSKDALLFNSIVGDPRQMVPLDPNILRAVVERQHIDVQAANVPLPPRAAPAEPVAPKRVYIRAGVEFRKYGPTVGCIGVDAALVEGKPKNHTEECRQRIVRAMADDPALAPRIEESAARAAVKN